MEKSYLLVRTIRAKEGWTRVRAFSILIFELCILFGYVTTVILLCWFYIIVLFGLVLCLIAGETWSMVNNIEIVNFMRKKSLVF